MFDPVPYQVPTVGANAVTGEKIQPGRMPFFGPRLRARGVISRNACHKPGTGEDDDRGSADTPKPPLQGPGSASP